MTSRSCRYANKSAKPAAATRNHSPIITSVARTNKPTNSTYIPGPEGTGTQDQPRYRKWNEGSIHKGAIHP